MRLGAAGRHALSVALSVTSPALLSPFTSRLPMEAPPAPSMPTIGPNGPSLSPPPKFSGVGANASPSPPTIAHVSGTGDAAPENGEE